MTTVKEPVMVRLDPEMKERLRQHAHNQRQSMSAVVERLIVAELNLAIELEREDARETELIQRHATGEHEAIQ